MRNKVGKFLSTDKGKTVLWILLLVVLLAVLVKTGWPKNPLEWLTPETPEFNLTEEQRYKLYLFEKSASYGQFKRLRAIAEAESNWRQYDSEGNVLRGYKDGKDIGIFQILTIHQTKAKELGMDIYTPEGNMDYALYLYEKNGTRDWNASKKKWNSP